MLKYHVKTDSDGVTAGYLSDDLVCVSRGIDVHLNPNTDYTVTIEEGKPVRYPRYFVPNWTHSSYLRFDSPNKFPVAIGDDGIGDPVLRKLQDVEKNIGYREVTREQAEAHIRDEPKPEPGPETCVWTWDENTNTFVAGCVNDIHWDSPSTSLMSYCPHCTHIIERFIPESEPEIPETHRKPTQWERENYVPPEGSLALTANDNQWVNWVLNEWEDEMSIKEIVVPIDWNPQLPNNFRVMEPWEVVVVAELGLELGLDKPETYYLWNGKQWVELLCSPILHTDKQYAVPENFSVMPKCRDCGWPTIFKYREVKGERGWESWCFVGCSREDYDTCGRLCATKAEAVEAYPRK